MDNQDYEWLAYWVDCGDWSKDKLPDSWQLSLQHANGYSNAQFREHMHQLLEDAKLGRKVRELI